MFSFNYSIVFYQSTDYINNKIIFYVLLQGLVSHHTETLTAVKDTEAIEINVSMIL